MRNYLLLATACLICLNACKNESKKDQTPEEVLQEYQGYIDRNEFDAAKQLSTPAGQNWLSELAEIISMEQPDSTILNTEFLTMNCTGEGDTLICACQMRDQYEQYPAEYILVRINERWLVDAPREEIIIEDDIIEAIPDSLLEKMMEQE
ncbi:MAG TPA: hypothetical protein PKA00_06325 [Saprospiraceae bacterium]|nr:hypothetical protein [Saprospiraceae bacterium]HMQ82501.1 hypothetical protein [Saprospiraceae bacterium]